MLEPNSNANLSEREQEILRLAATGASNKEIAQQLVISPNTVKVHLRNIFAKIGVTSRTEATLYAIQHGHAPVPGAVAVADNPESATVEALAAETIPTPVSSPETTKAGRPAWRYVSIFGLVFIALVGIWLMATSLRPASPQIAAPSPAPTLARWEEKAPVPTARSGLAATVYENQIYAIGGEAVTGVTGAMERYDPQANRWETLTTKPVPVTDVQATVIGGRIYVPGGRLASGAVTDVLEAYDPREDHWDQRAPLPVALSAYALAAFEGKLYMFGGWDGEKFVASVYTYDPNNNIWAERTPMPTARGFAGVALVGGKIYVIGGTDGKKALIVNEEYAAENDMPVTSRAAWQERQPLPVALAHSGAVAVADTIYILGNAGPTSSPSSFAYFPQEDAWRSFEMVSTVGPWTEPALVALDSRVHALGGAGAQGPTADHVALQVIYTVLLPSISK